MSKEPQGAKPSWWNDIMEDSHTNERYITLTLWQVNETLNRLEVLLTQIEQNTRK